MNKKNWQISVAQKSPGLETTDLNKLSKYTCFRYNKKFLIFQILCVAYPLPFDDIATI